MGALRIGSQAGTRNGGIWGLNNNKLVARLILEAVTLRQLVFHTDRATVLLSAQKDYFGRAVIKDQQ
ncbi:hypothetical protein MESS4_330136 [Mesorhizobium sp. STM 4661]|nr:hypothetical protein MESS4_330136 [Mesorhizobium sp. STM 4661]